MRRAFLKLCAGLGVLALQPAVAVATDTDNWTVFKRRFLRGERIADTGNDDVSHSESQGWGMLFAEDNNDRETFQKLWEWTSSKLQRSDGLFSWRWSPKGPEPVADKNNAADGDILIAWALARAAKRWDDPHLASESEAVRSAIVETLAVELQGHLVLLPGVQGFARKDFRVVNLSYYVWPALSAFAGMGGEHAGTWRRLQTDGLSLLDKAAFGSFHLPPDWLLVGDRDLKIADGWPPHFGFDAVRIPLYLAWHNDAPRLSRFLAFWRTPKFGGKPPAWINLRDGSVAPFPAPGGYTAIFALCQFVGEGFKTDAPVAAVVDSDDYYSASLKLLSNIAAHEAPSAPRP
jgi:endoglucanase